MLIIIIIIISSGGIGPKGKMMNDTYLEERTEPSLKRPDTHFLLEQFSIYRFLKHFNAENKSWKLTSSHQTWKLLPFPHQRPSSPWCGHLCPRTASHPPH